MTTLLFQQVSENGEFQTEFVKSVIVDSFPKSDVNLLQIIESCETDDIKSKKLKLCKHRAPFFFCFFPLLSDKLDETNPTAWTINISFPFELVIIFNMIWWSREIDTLCICIFIEEFSIELNQIKTEIRKNL